MGGGGVCATAVAVPLDLYVCTLPDLEGGAKAGDPMAAYCMRQVGVRVRVRVRVGEGWGWGWG